MSKAASLCMLTLSCIGACISSDGSRTCVATPYSMTPQLLNEAFVSQSGRQNTQSSIPSLRTLQTALRLQRDIFFCMQSFAGALFVVGTLLFAARVLIQVSKRKERSWRFIDQDWSGKVLLLSITVSLISATSITQTSNALRFATRESAVRSLHIKVGYTLQVLQWLASASSATFYIVGARRIAKQTQGTLSEDEETTSLKAPKEEKKKVNPPPPPRPRPPPPPPPGR